MERVSVNVLGKGMVLPTVFRIVSEWTYIAHVSSASTCSGVPASVSCASMHSSCMWLLQESSMHAVISVNEGLMTSGSLDLKVRLRLRLSALLDADNTPPRASTTCVTATPQYLCCPLQMLLAMIVTGVAIPVACWAVLSCFYCKWCPAFRRLGFRRRSVAPNRQNPMLKMERLSYTAVHGPFPDVADVRGIVQVASAK